MLPNTDLPTPPADQIGGIPQLQMDRAKADEASQKVDQSESQLTDLAQQHAGEVQGREQQLIGMEANQPQNMIGFAMKQSPILMALSALAGGHSKTFGLTALASLNGMVQGVKAGSDQQYKDAETKYQQAVQMMQERWRLQNEVYNSLEQAYGNTLNGNIRRWTIANAAVGNDEKIAQDTFTNRMDIAKFYQTAARQDEDRQARISHDKEMERIALMNAGSRAEDADTRKNKPAAGGASQAKADELARSIESNLKDTIELIKTNPGTTGMRGKVSSALETAKGATGIGTTDSAAHRVNAKLTELKAQVAAFNKLRPGVQSMQTFEAVVGSQGLGSSDPDVIARLEDQLKEMERDRNHGKTSADLGEIEGPDKSPQGVPYNIGDMVDAGGKRLKYLGSKKWQTVQ
jgi:hypothetical protein